MEGKHEMSPEEILVLDEWLGDVKGMTFALIQAEITSRPCAFSVAKIPYTVTEARTIVEAVNEEIAGIAQATLAERNRRLDSLDGEADPERAG